MSKKILSLFTVLVLAFTLCSCASEERKFEVEPVAAVAAIKAEERENNFAADAVTYMEYIGKNLKDRAAENTPDNEHDKAIEWIISELKKSGYKDEQIEKQIFKEKGVFKGYEATNVILSVEGKDTSKQLIVGTHYDGTGVGDNGSGVALLLATAKGLKDQTPAYNVKYIFFDAEENGLFGSKYYASHMSKQEINSTYYMVDVDALVFGDYCNIYGGEQKLFGKIVGTEAYELTVSRAKSLGINVYDTEYLDGYYQKNGKGPELDENGLFTNPWTKQNPPPNNEEAYSPTIPDISDHAPFSEKGIPYVVLEASNWYADGGEELAWTDTSFTGYYDTGNTKIGQNGMFMNTEYDTLENLNKYFPNRALEHYNIYSPLLSSLIMQAI